MAIRKINKSSSQWKKRVNGHENGYKEAATVMCNVVYVCMYV